MNSVVAFISDHGFGHASRSAVILAELLKRGYQIVIVTSVPRWFFVEKFIKSPKNWHYIQQRVDVGLAQVSGVESDYLATLDSLDHHWQNMDNNITKVLSEIKSFSPSLVYTDISAMGVLVAEKLSVPVVAVSNFSWDWIYDDLINGSPEREGFAYYRDLHRNIYANVDLLLTLPYPGDFSAFKCKRIDLPWVGDLAEINRDDVLKKLGLDCQKKFVLYSFGGHDLPGLDVAKWMIPNDWEVLVVGHSFESDNRQLHNFTNPEITKRGVTYTEIVAAVDVVVTKPGYGIVTDCIFNKTPVLHVERGEFAEYPFLVKALNENLSNKKISLEQIATANIFSEAEAIISEFIQPSYSLDGSQLAADHIESFLESKS